MHSGPVLPDRVRYRRARRRNSNTIRRTGVVTSTPERMRKRRLASPRPAGLLLMRNQAGANEPLPDMPTPRVRDGRRDRPREQRLSSCAGACQGCSKRRRAVETTGITSLVSRQACEARVLRAAPSEVRPHCGVLERNAFGALGESARIGVLKREVVVNGPAQVNSPSRSHSLDRPHRLSPRPGWTTRLSGPSLV